MSKKPLDPMKVPIKPHADDVYVWQEETDGVNGNNGDSSSSEGHLHDWENTPLKLTCKYCEANPCVCNKGNVPSER